MFKSFTFVFSLLLLMGLTSVAQAATAEISQVSPNPLAAGDELVIKGEDFGNTKGNVYVGDKKYPYYGHSISQWTDKEIIVETDPESRLYDGKVGVQVRSSSGVLGDIVYGPFINIQPAITNVNPTSASPGDSITILGSAFNTYSNTKPTIYINDVATEVAYWSHNVIRITVPDNATSGDLKLVFGNYKTMISEYISVTTALSDNVQLTSQWYLPAINATAAQNSYSGSRNVVVAVIDDGVYLGHPDLEDNIWVNSDEIEGNGKDDDNNGFVDDRWGWNFAYSSKDMTTSGTHGTMVAGIIGASHDSDSLVQGINSRVSIMPLIISDQYGFIDSYYIRKAIEYAVDNGADVINLSLGSALYYYSNEFDEAINYAYDNNVLVVAAAGNGDTEGGIGRDLGLTKVSPVCNDGSGNRVLGVGATDKGNEKTSWSNFGECVDIYAPGLDITSTAVPTHIDSGLFYDSASGTSFSAPLVSGAAALIKSRFPSISSRAIMNRIINNSQEVGGIKVLDVYQAILPELSDSEKYSASSSSSSSSSSGQNFSDYISREKNLLTTIDQAMSNRLSGQILLQVEDHGEAWYIFPDNKKRYYLGTASAAYEIMRKLGLGATHEFISSHTLFPDYVLGKILLDVEMNGEAYYINPLDRKAYYMKNGADAYEIMRNFGLGITNLDIHKINIGEVQ